MAGETDNSQAIVAVPGGDGQPFSSTAIVPAGDVRTAGFDLNEIKKLATQTKAIGVILPPPDIRAIVDKTATFVAKHGPEFEKRILANERNNAKFNFLVPTDPYHAYYQMRIKEFAGTSGAADGKDAAAAAAELGKAGTAPAPQVIPHALAKLEKPEDELYTVHVPEGLSLLELDVIKLAAQFVARNGKNFLSGLQSREHTNPLFNFLRPTHSLFGFFTTLCDAYSRVLMPPKGTKDRLAKDADDSAGVLERAMKRLEWERVKEREMQDAADEAERERLAYQAIDWHDFVVVETIEFFDDEDEELPPPLTLKDVINMNKAREYQEAEEKAAAEAAAAAADKAAQGLPMSEEEKALVAQAAAVSLGKEEAQPQEAPQEEEMEMEVEEDTGPARPAVQAAPEPEEDEGPMLVVKDYVRPTGRMARMKNGQLYDPTKFAVSPITGELVALDDMEEHMRVSLIDPRWKEQREAMLSKIKETTAAPADEISRNLLGLAKTRPDIFGSTEEEVTQVVSESIREKLTSGANRPVAWDGVTQKGPELAAQLANIQQNRATMGSTTQAPSTAQVGPAAPAIPPARTSQMPTPTPPQPSTLQRPAGLPAMPPPPPRIPPGPPMSIPPPPTGLMPPPPMGMPPAGLVAPAGLPMGIPPPPLPGMPAPPPREAPPPMPGDQPEAKRPRLDDVFVLQPEQEFLARYNGPSTVRVQCPDLEGYDKLIGQLMEVQVASLMDTVGQFKERLSGVVDLPANKMKLSRDGVGILKDDTATLAYYNVSPDVVLGMSAKERARGRRGGGQ